MMDDQIIVSHRNRRAVTIFTHADRDLGSVRMHYHFVHACAPGSRRAGKLLRQSSSRDEDLSSRVQSFRIPYELFPFQIYTGRAEPLTR